MKMDTAKIIGYHGTCSLHAESIAKHGFDPSLVRFRNDHWLGQGVYFFNLPDLAMWWASDISGKSHNKGSFPIVYQVNIEADSKEILDLDNYQEYDQFMTDILEIQKEIEENIKERVPVFNQPQFRAVYFDYYKQIHGISVIIFTFSKDCTCYGTFRSPDKLARQKKLAKALGLSYHEKQICVSKKECIKDVTIIYNGEDEVI